jgi:hypothetical protein
MTFLRTRPMIVKGAGIGVMKMERGRVFYGKEEGFKVFKGMYSSY